MKLHLEHIKTPAVLLLAFSPMDKGHIAQSRQCLGYEVWDGIAAGRGRCGRGSAHSRAEGFRLQPRKHVLELTHFITTPHGCWPAATTAH